MLWAAAGQAGVCPSGFPTDDDAAGLWGLGLHNYLLRANRMRPAPDDGFFAGLSSFERGQQALRFTSFSRPSRSGLAHLKMIRTGCQSDELLPVPFSVLSELAGRSRRKAIAESLFTILTSAREAVRVDWVSGLGILDARLLDLWTWIQEEREDGEESTPSKQGFEQLSERVLMLPVADWAQLVPDRALRIYDAAEGKLSPDRQKEVLFALLAKAIERQDGLFAERVLGRFDGPREALRQEVQEPEWLSQFANLDTADRFSGRAFFHFRRGLIFEQTGNAEGALRSFAFALQTAGDSNVLQETVTRQSLQWVSYILSRYEADQNVLRVLRQVLPREHYQPVWTELVWAALFQLDRKTFELLMANRSGRGRVSADLRKFTPYVSGRSTEFWREIRRLFRSQSGQAVRLAAAYVTALERQSYDVRLKHREALRQFRSLLEEWGDANGSRRAASQLQRSAAVLQQIDAIEATFPTRAPERAQNLNPDAVLSAGAVRLPPAADLAWPFAREPEEEADVFTPIGLRVVGFDAGKQQILWKLEDQ